MKRGYLKRNVIAVFFVITMTSFSVQQAYARSICTVNTSELRLRQKPAKKAHIVTLLSKGAIVVAEDRCAGGWVKVRSEDGRYSGYVGGWALTPVNFSEENRGTEKGDSGEPQSPKEHIQPVVATPVHEKDESFHEKLAIQITELRIKVINIERNMKFLKKEVRGMKTFFEQNRGK